MVQSIRSKERTSLMSSIWQDIVGFFKDLKELGSFLIENTKGILTAIALMVVFFGTIIAIERYKEGDGYQGYGGICHHPDCQCCKSN